MEYTQWGLAALAAFIIGLNPCCNGIYSMRILQTISIKISCVLILVVMEYTQWVGHNIPIVPKVKVLILVVMEYTQWEWNTSNNIY